MHRPRRLLALIALAVMLQLILLGSGLACAMPGMGDRTASAGMAQMHMGGSSSMPAASGHVPDNDQAPCSFPWAPAGCQSMTPCAPATLGASVGAVLPAPPHAHDVMRLVVLAPPSRGIPPELPPPRA